MPEYYAIVTTIPGYYVIGEIPSTAPMYQPGKPSITLRDPLTVRVKDGKLAVEDYEAVEGDVTFMLAQHTAVGKLKQNLYAPILQFRELRAANVGKKIEDVAKELIDGSKQV
jgi:hypothetical protein